MILTLSTLQVRIVLEAVKTTNDVEFSGSYRDKAQNDLIVPGVFSGKTNGNVAVTMVPAPANNVSRLIDDFFIYNADTITQAVQIILYDGVNSYRMRRVSLATLTNFQFSGKVGFAA